MMEWKQREASDSFKAIADILGVHQICRLCIHVATKLQATEEKEKGAAQPTDAIPISKQAVDALLAPRLIEETWERKQLSTRVPLNPCTCRPSEIGPLSGLRQFLNKQTRGLVVHRIFVRERGTFRYHTVYMDSSDLTVRMLYAKVYETFMEADYKPTWIENRKELGIKWATWHVYRIHPTGITHRQAFGNGSFVTDDQFRDHMRGHPCPKFEVILV
jgi:glycoprotein 3-alpha-L-fucosyltransferase